MASSDYRERVWQGVPEGLPPPEWRARRAFLLREARPAARVLDLGCGEGWFTAALLDAGTRPLGADVAAEPLRRASRRRAELELIQLDDETAWELKDAEFDIVWAGEVIEHVVEVERWLSEVRRVLRPRGKLLLSTPAHGPLTLLCCAILPRRFAMRFHPLSDHVRFFNERSLVELLNDFGFEQIAIRQIGGLPLARATMLVSATRTRW